MIALPLLLATLLSGQLICNGAPVETSSVMRLPAGYCRTEKPIVLWGDTTITGAPNYGTSIRAQRGGIGTQAKLTLRDVDLWRADTPTETGTRAIGLNLAGASVVEHVQISGFTVGALITGAEALETNADFTQWRNVEITGSAHSAMIVDGGVTNAGTFTGIRWTSSCERPDRWEKEFGTCTGGRDGSFLMNTWIGVTIHNTLNGRPPFISLNRRSPGNQHSLWLGTYCERGQGKPVADIYTIVLGGNCGLPDQGLRIDGPTFSGGDFVNDQPAKTGTTHVKLGRSSRPGGFECKFADGIDKSRGLCTEVEVRGTDPKDKCYINRIAGQTRAGETCQDGAVHLPAPKAVEGGGK